MQKKKLKLQLLREWKDKHGSWIHCRDENSVDWTISKTAYNAFKRTGFLIVSESVQDKFNKILQDKIYHSLEEDERKDILARLLVAFTGNPIETIFPSLA